MDITLSRPGVRKPGVTTTRRIAVAAMIGTAIEWYDFFLYGIAAALIIGPRFFPAATPTAATLAAFSTFAVGFLARPGAAAGTAAWSSWPPRSGWSRPTWRSCWPRCCPARRLPRGAGGCRSC